MSELRERLSFDPERHEYRYDGRIVPHVTGVLGIVNRLWINGEALERARQEGQAIHKVIQYEIEGVDYDCPEWLLPHRTAWQAFVAETGFGADTCEKPLYSGQYGFAGTPDMAGELTKLKGRPRAVIDAKRTLGGRVVGLQVAAYDKLLGGGHRRFGLQLEPLRFREYDDPQDWTIFLACLTIWRHVQKNLPSQ